MKRLLCYSAIDGLCALMNGRDVEKVEDWSMAQVFAEKKELEELGIDIEIKMMTPRRLQQMVEASRARMRAKQ